MRTIIEDVVKYANNVSPQEFEERVMRRVGQAPEQKRFITFTINEEEDIVVTYDLIGGVMHNIVVEKDKQKIGKITGGSI